MSILKTLTLLCLFGGALAKSMVKRSNSELVCPKVETLPSFDQDEYVGRWYGVRMYPGPNSYVSCMRGNYNSDGEGGLLSTSSLKILRTGQMHEKQSVFEQLNQSEPAKLKLATLSEPYIEEDYWILATDYTSYALVYKCRNGRPRATILARVPEVDDSEIAEAFFSAERNGLDREKFVPIDQTNCSEN